MLEGSVECHSLKLNVTDHVVVFGGLGVKMGWVLSQRRARKCPNSH